MSDPYQVFTQTSIGKTLVESLGLPVPTELDRWSEGVPLVDGTVVLGGDGVLGEALTASLDGLGIVSTREPADGEKYKGLVFDATGITTTDDLARLQRFFTPLMRSLADMRPGRRARQATLSSSRAKSGSPSVPSRASPAHSARRSAGAAPPSSCTSPPGPKAPSTRPWRSCSRRSRPTSPVRSSGSG